jgi:translation initiation factor IF-1
MAELRGTVIEVRPQLLYRVRLEGGTVVLAGLGEEIRLQSGRVVVGDHVLVQISENDPNRGKILKKAFK